MSQRHQNIPIEIFRTIIAVLETGSLTKAALKLGLSQPAVSSQIRKIELFVGGSVLQKTANGSSPTELGKLVIANARKILSANEQILALGGASSGPELVRIGLSSLLVREFMLRQNANRMSDVQLVSDNSANIAKMLTDGQIDIACIFEDGDVSEISSLIVDEFEEELIWVRSKDFVLSPGSPIPIISWSGEDWMATALAKHGLTFRIAFNGQDFEAKKSAVEAGIGITALPKRLLPAYLVHAKEYYLPILPMMRGLLCVKPGVQTQRSAEIEDALRKIFFDQPPRQVEMKVVTNAP